MGFKIRQTKTLSLCLLSHSDEGNHNNLCDKDVYANFKLINFCIFNEDIYEKFVPEIILILPKHIQNIYVEKRGKTIRCNVVEKLVQNIFKKKVD